MESNGLLKIFSKIILRMIGAGLAVAFGFWLFVASNMGPAYLPHIMDGALGFWIRMTLLGLGVGVGLITAVWFIWLIQRYVFVLINRLMKRHQ